MENTERSTITGNILLDNALALGAFAVMGIVGIRVYKKQTLAAQKRKENPEMSYHESIVESWNELGYEHPFKI